MGVGALYYTFILISTDESIIWTSELLIAQILRTRFQTLRTPYSIHIIVCVTKYIVLYYWFKKNEGYCIIFIFEVYASFIIL